MPLQSKMPTYEYRCPKGHDFELFQSMSEEPGADCPECGEAAERLMSGGAGLIFKGEGFYITDYRSEEYKKAASSDKEPASSDKEPASSDKKMASSEEKTSSSESGAKSSAGATSSEGSSSSSSTGSDKGTSGSKSADKSSASDT